MANSNWKHELALLSAVLVTIINTADCQAQKPASDGFQQGASAPAGFTFSRMWKGQELWPFATEGTGKFAGSKDPSAWRSLPGVTLSLRYPGTGPLPAPQEFVIKLDQPLPYGPAYRLFVKNFYRGKMEATLGDVTRPLTIKRFDWTPGTVFEPNAAFDKIVLRYFPTSGIADNDVAIVANNGVAQEQHYIVQGVFLTTDVNKVPIRGGEIIGTLPEEEPVARKGNYLDNAGFEAGLFPWGKPFGVSAAYGPENLDASTAGQGKYSFKRKLDEPSGRLKNGGEEQILESRNYSLPPGQYTLSFQAKSDQPLTLTARIMGATEDLRTAAPAGVTQNFKLTDQWQQYSVTGDLKAMPGFLNYLDFAVRSGEPSTIWLDAVQLQNGAATKFQPARATEVGYVCGTPGNIFYAGQGGNVDLLVHDTSGQQQATVSYRVVDYWGQEVGKGVKQVPIAGNSGRLALSLPARKKGIYRVILSSGESISEMVYSIVPANTHLASKYPAGTLGVDTHFEAKQLAILKRANFNWVNSKFLARWFLVEKEEGKYGFDDRAIANADRAKMEVLLQPLNVDWGRQEWLRPYARPEGGGVWDPAKRKVYMQRWGQVIYELVNRYKGTVKYWEIENEPFADYTYEQYAELLQVAVESVRKADPQAKIVAFSGGGFDEKGYESVLQTVSPEQLDVFSVHIYNGNDASAFAAFAPLLKKYNKPGWNTETGTTCPTFFTTLPEYDALRRTDYWQALQNEIRAQAISTAHNYLLTVSVGGMEKYFYYFGRFVNAGPSQATSRFGSGKEIVEFDGGLRANGVALCIASHFIDGAKYSGAVSLDERLQVHVYQKGAGSVGFLWGRAEQTLSLTGGNGLSFYDIMGNPIEDKVLTVTDSPIYFTFAGAPTQVGQLLQEMKIAAAQ